MKDIIGYEGLYAITSCGKVWSYRTKKFLAPGQNPNGYLHVSLYKDKKKKIYSIHRLVAETYLGKPDDESLVVDHIDSVRTHNYLSNLQWITQKENCEKQAKSKRVGQYDLDGNLIKIYKTCRSAELEDGYNEDSISLCCRGKKPTYRNYIWKYVE